jgi:hypothetical protein
MGGACAWICVERGLGGIVAITPVTVEVWTTSWWNEWSHVRSERSSHVQFTVHGHVCPIGKNGCCGGGPHGSLPCQRAPRVPRARQKYAKRVRRSYAYTTGVGEAEIVPDGT